MRKLKCFRVIGLFLFVTLLYWGTFAQTAVAKPTLTVWFFRSYYKGANEYFQQICDQFATKYDCNVKTRFLPYMELDLKTVSAIEAGRPPDVSEFQAVGAARYYGMGQLLDVTDLANEIAAKGGGFSEIGRMSTYIDNKFWAVPHVYQEIPWYWRTDLFKEIGYNRAPRTWDEAVEISQKLTDPAKEQWGLGITLGRSNDGDLTSQTLLWAFGAREVDEQGNVAIDSPETLKTLEFAYDLYKKKNIIPPGAMGWGDGDNNEAYMEGKIAQTINGGTVWATMLAQNHPLVPHTDMTVWPAGTEIATIDDPVSYGIFKATKHPELAKDFVRYLFEEERYRKTIEISKGLFFPALRKYETMPMWSEPVIKGYKENFEYGRWIGWPGPVTPAAAEVRAEHIYSDMFARIIIHRISPRKALNEAVTKIKAIYEVFKH